MLAGEGRHGLAACGCAVLGGDGGAVELGDLHEVGAGPELVLERIEARGELGGIGLGHEASFSCFAVIAHECTHSPFTWWCAIGDGCVLHMGACSQSPRRPREPHV